MLIYWRVIVNSLHLLLHYLSATEKSESLLGAGLMLEATQAPQIGAPRVTEGQNDDWDFITKNMG
jgi:hypothetical protein